MRLSMLRARLSMDILATSRRDIPLAEDSVVPLLFVAVVLFEVVVALVIDGLAILGDVSTTKTTIMLCGRCR